MIVFFSNTLTPGIANQKSAAVESTNVFGLSVFNVENGFIRLFHQTLLFYLFYTVPRVRLRSLSYQIMNMTGTFA
jgi:hypothetical protein